MDTVTQWAVDHHNHSFGIVDYSNEYIARKRIGEADCRKAGCRLLVRTVELPSWGVADA